MEKEPTEYTSASSHLMTPSTDYYSYQNDNLCVLTLLEANMTLGTWGRRRGP